MPTASISSSRRSRARPARRSHRARACVSSSAVGASRSTVSRRTRSGGVDHPEVRDARVDVDAEHAPGARAGPGGGPDRGGRRLGLELAGTGATVLDGGGAVTARAAGTIVTPATPRRLRPLRRRPRRGAAVPGAGGAAGAGSASELRLRIPPDRRVGHRVRLDGVDVGHRRVDLLVDGDQADARLLAAHRRVRASGSHAGSGRRRPADPSGLM